MLLSACFFFDSENDVSDFIVRNFDEKAVKKLYDIIIIDCPPIIGLSDAIVMTKYSDANILVISSKKTKIELVERVQKIFKQANATLTGVIINKAEVKGNSYYGYYDKYYGDNE